MTRQSVYGEQTEMILELAEQVRTKAMRNLERDRPLTAPESETEPERIFIVVDRRALEPWVIEGLVDNPSATRLSTAGRRGTGRRAHTAGS